MSENSKKSTTINSLPELNDEKLRTKMLQLNKERLYIRKIKMIPWISIGVFLLSFLVLFTLGMTNTKSSILYIISSCCAVGSFLFIIIYSLFFLKKELEFRKKYKKEINNIIFSSFLDNYKYAPNYGISRNYVAGTNSIIMGDNFYTEDAVYGVYNGVNFLRCDMTMEDEYTDSDGDRHTVTIFSGQWFKMDFPKRFKSNVQIFSKDFSNVDKNKKSRFFSKISKKTRENNLGKRIQVQTESEEFNKKFKIYASSEHDAFYVLTPKLIEAIQKLKDELDMPFMILFTDNSLDIALDSRKDSLEPSYKKDMDVALSLSVKDAVEEITILMKFIDYLDLEKDLFVF